MDRIRIKGGRQLKGEIVVSGREITAEDRAGGHFNKKANGKKGRRSAAFHPPA